MVLEEIDVTGYYFFDCNKCLSRCDGKSKRNYIFEKDVEYSESKEKQLVDIINGFGGYEAKKSIIDGYPDIEVKEIKSNLSFYIEVKAQRRTFMKVQEYFPDGELVPSETVALNLSDLLRYFEIREKTNLNIFILWFLENRPCVVQDGAAAMFYQHIDRLKEIYQKYTDKRRFRRGSGNGDYVNGKHKGVVVNYHFSLRELKEFDLNEVLNWGISK